MAPKKTIYSALMMALFASQANAIGFGEIALQSRIGERLRAEIPLQQATGEAPEISCFKLIRDDSSDLPSITGANLRLLRKSDGYYLGIQGYKPENNPVFVINVRVNCGSELQRTYLLMPEPPIFLPADDSSRPAASSPATHRDTRQAREGETLSEIAKSMSAGSARQQSRILYALQQANPEIDADETLGEGMEIRIPKIRQQVAKPPATPRPRAEKAENTRRQDSTDRLVVGQPPANLPTAGKPVVAEGAAEPVTLAHIEERILKLETSLHTLQTEIHKLDEALVEANTAMIERNRLLLAQRIDTPNIQSSVPLPPPNGDSLLKLLLSAIAGGTFTVLLARLLSRRQERLADQEMSLTMQGYHPEVYVTPPPPPVREEIEAVDIPLHQAAFNPAAPEENEFSLGNPLSPGFRLEEPEFDTGPGELELIDVLLASGRERGAAEMLSMYIDDHAPEDFQTWKRLADLFRKCNMRSEFEALRPRIQEKFNIQIPDWMPDDASSPPPLL